MLEAEDVLRRHHTANPSALPSLLKTVTIRDVVKAFTTESSNSLSEDEQAEIWETLQVLSTPSRFMSLLRSIRKLSDDDNGSGIFDILKRMQERVHFPFLQQYRFPGQGSATDFPFIFKMLVKGHGSGLDLLKRMRPGEDLEGTWVMFDVMHRIKDGWLTLSAHVYDHNYRALCTIWTCELKAENQESCEIAWEKMIEVARFYGFCAIHIHGFMADNAAAGWNAIRKVFFGGIKNPARERSDTFHYAQSLCRHTQDCIKESSREEHLAWWKLLRSAPNVVAAYRISQDIAKWWRNGNAYPDKIKELHGWMAWWVVRWMQWGTYIRLVSSGFNICPCVSLFYWISSHFFRQPDWF